MQHSTKLNQSGLRRNASCAGAAWYFLKRYSLSFKCIAENAFARRQPKLLIYAPISFSSHAQFSANNQGIPNMGAQWKAKGKELAANAKGKLFGRLAKDIMIAARSGADPASNSRLRLVVEQARKVSMPKDTLERAIKKGAGLTGEAVNFEHVIYEGFAPHRVAVMVECLTDNVNRTAPEMRVLFRKGQLGTSGSVSWDFNHVGLIEAEASAAGADAEVAAIEAGAQDFEAGEEAGITVFVTDATDLDLVSRALPAHGFSVLSAKLGYKPKNPIDPASLSAEQLEEVESFLSAIDANDDVQNVFVGLAG
jgi:YebC/PmpR family DNA-binding regulatory protein